MSKNILVIGGTRFFGRLLIRRLLDAGHTVTMATRGNAADDFGDDVRRIRVDRRDEVAMLDAFAGCDSYDIIYDQMCYTPLDAAISIKVFQGKVKRYVMSSTIEVYNDFRGQRNQPFSEDDLDLSQQDIRYDYPWQLPELSEDSYGMGKRQTEALLYQDGTLPIVSIRIAHVLAGLDDFTGRLAHYVRQVKQGEPLEHSCTPGQSSFLEPQEISKFMCWVGDGAFWGPINAACDGPLSAIDIYKRVGRVLKKPVNLEPVSTLVLPSQLSPFDYPMPYRMDTQRAKLLGYSFSHSDMWFDDLIRQHEAGL